MGTLSNHYSAARVLHLGSTGERGPFLVVQVGSAPEDEQARERLFVLRKDAAWVDFNAYASNGNPEAMVDLFFGSSREIVERFNDLGPTPYVLELPVDPAGLAAWLARSKNENLVEEARSWAAAYWERHRES